MTLVRVCFDTGCDQNDGNFRCTAREIDLDEEHGCTSFTGEEDWDAEDEEEEEMELEEGMNQ